MDIVRWLAGSAALSVVILGRTLFQKRAVDALRAWRYLALGSALADS